MRRRFPGRLVMAAIILSCGLVMHAEQSENAARPQRPHQELTTRDVAFNTAGPDGQMHALHAQRPGTSW